jgi:hypothetical protein
MVDEFVDPINEISETPHPRVNANYGQCNTGINWFVISSASEAELSWVVLGRLSKVQCSHVSSSYTVIVYSTVLRLQC